LIADATAIRQAASIVKQMGRHAGANGEQVILQELEE
jgi:hypothetical protein